MNRVLPQRSWAGAVPTVVTQEEFETLCKPCVHPEEELPPGPDMSPLERFLGCAYMRKQLQRQIQTEEYMRLLPGTEPGVVMFKVDVFQCQVFLNLNHMQSMHIKISQQPPQQQQQQQHMGPGGMMVPQEVKQLAPDEIQLIEQFFDTRIVAPPYRPNSLVMFGRLMNISPCRLQKDFIQLMRLDMMPMVHGFKWVMQFCLRVPPSATPIAPIGMPGIMLGRGKILFFVSR